MAGGYGNDPPQGFSNRTEKVAIVGAGGRVGKHIAEHLLKTGKHVVTAIARPSSTSKLPEGVQVARVDYSGDDDAALVEALRGQQVLIITMSVAAPSRTILKLVRAAARPACRMSRLTGSATMPPITRCATTTFLATTATASVPRSRASASARTCCWSATSGTSLAWAADRIATASISRSALSSCSTTATWPSILAPGLNAGRAIASLLSLKELPDDETDRSPTLSQFRNGSIYISSFRLSQRDIFEGVKRVTGTTSADWTITHESAEQRWKDDQAALQQGNRKAFTKMLYSRMFFPNGDGDYQSSRGLHNDLLGLAVEDLDEFTAIGVRMGEDGEVSQSN